MCGIVGIYNFRDGAPVNLALVRAMTERLWHRGPDDHGYYASGPLALGMRRLSIIDLEGGKQPIANEDGSVQVVCNGEIYNHRQLRQELESRGHRFRTQSDTEVIVHGYEAYGVEVLNHLNGMFAFALWDAQRKALIVARDRLGIKPLYRAETCSGIVLASELKALVLCPEVRRDIDPIAVQQYLTWEYIPAPRTPFASVRKVEPASYLFIDPHGIREGVYWRLEEEPPIRTLGEATEGLRWHLARSARLQIQADVPVGAFLSGGLDSSALVSTLKEVGGSPLHTFSIGFAEDRFDETPHARRVAEALGTVHEEEILRPNCLDLVQEVGAFLDEPFADSSILPTYLVSRVARRRVKVVLSGDGGDELFGGYDHYKADRIAGWYGRLPSPFRALMQSSLVGNSSWGGGSGAAWRRHIARLEDGLSLPASLEHARWMVRATKLVREELWRPSAAGAGSANWLEPLERAFLRSTFKRRLTRQLEVDLRTYLVDDILFKVDRASMATSLEVRVPFLDHELVEYAFRIPARWKLRRLTGKWVLRKAFEGILPREIQRRRKAGFSVPVAAWLRGDLRSLAHDLLSPARVKRQGLFRPETIVRLLREHTFGLADHGRTLWALIMFELWSERFSRGVAQGARSVPVAEIVSRSREKGEAAASAG